MKKALVILSGIILSANPIAWILWHNPVSILFGIFALIHVGIIWVQFYTLDDP